jgi:hypothetical protein
MSLDVGLETDERRLTIMLRPCGDVPEPGAMGSGRKAEYASTEDAVDQTGADHSDTLLSMGKLAGTYRSQGRWDTAEKLEVQVMEMRQTRLGRDHPAMLVSSEQMGLQTTQLHNHATTKPHNHTTTRSHDHIITQTNNQSSNPGRLSYSHSEERNQRAG